MVTELHFLVTFFWPVKVVYGTLGLNRQWPYDAVNAIGFALWLQYIFSLHHIDIYFFLIFAVSAAGVVMLPKHNF